MHFFVRLAVACVWIGVSAAPVTRGQTVEEASAESLKFFETSIRPVLAQKCYRCHSDEKVSGGLRVDHISTLVKGGDSGPALVPGKPDASFMIELVRRVDPDYAMPPDENDALSTQQLGDFERWIGMGAPWPEADVAAAVERDENGFTAKDKAWWAVQPLADVVVPAGESAWIRNDLDRFVLKKLDGLGLTPAVAAEASELLRRIHFDLVGVPPNPERLASFSDAYAKAPDAAVAAEVDQLLDDTRYGERWAQHWLDVVRYADSDGYNADGYRPDAFRYRDYVIRSFNEDKPYDTFVREQLAADEFAADDPATLIATAFLRNGVYEWNQRNAEMQWDLILTEMTNVTGEAFLGVGVGCAQCHDHKFDPILQKDYYALQSFLNSTWWPEDHFLATPEERDGYKTQLAAWEKATQDLRKELDALTGSYYKSSRENAAKVFPESVREMYAKDPMARTAYEEQIAQLVQRQVDAAIRTLDFKKKFEKDKDKLEQYQRLTEDLARFDSLKPKPLPTGFIATDVGPNAAKTFFSKKGGRVAVEPAFFTLLNLPVPTITPTAHTTGRRLALANWIANKDNPLSTRVIVNRLWQHHFATGLVKTPNDFGRLGELPSHPELLDWLTRQFLAGGWKMKPLHRLIMTSGTYRQTARREPGEKEVAADAGNRFLWRYPPKRLDAEQIRDSMLAVSGELKPLAGGPAVDGSATNRSVYVKRRRNTKDPMIGGFDAPLWFASEPDRLSTTTPLQSLMLVNGDFPRQRAVAFARRILGNRHQIDNESIQGAYRLAYGREAAAAEMTAAIEFIHSQSALVPSSDTGVDKYPNETGLRPTSQVFRDGNRLGLGKTSLWIQPESRFERLSFDGVSFPADGFTIEVVANLDRLYADASVNTLISQWNGSPQASGWSFGVTSKQSAYQPANVIVQLAGSTFQNEPFYEVVVSNLRFPLQKPMYVAAAISAKPSKDDVTKGCVTFYLKELGNPEATLQAETVEHQVVGGLDAAKAFQAILGGRDGTRGHLWDGQVGRIVVSAGVLPSDQLFVHGGTGGPRLLDWNFSGDDGEHPAPNTAWIRERQQRSGVPEAVLGAVTDFCQTLLTSNEFLYLH